MSTRYKTDAELLAECAALDLLYVTAAALDAEVPTQGDWIETQDRDEDDADHLRERGLP